MSSSPGENEQPETRPWADLPFDLLNLISANLIHCFAYFKFRAVCSSWRSSSKPPADIRMLPLLLLPHSPYSDDLSFFEPSTSKIFTIPFPETRHKIFLTSSYGWLALVCPDDSSFSLFNPFARSLIHLPPPNPQTPRSPETTDRYTWPYRVREGHPMYQFLSLQGVHVSIRLGLGSIPLPSSSIPLPDLRSHFLLFHFPPSGLVALPGSITTMRNIISSSKKIETRVVTNSSDPSIICPLSTSPSFPRIQLDIPTTKTLLLWLAMGRISSSYFVGLETLNGLTSGIMNTERTLGRRRSRSHVSISLA